MEFSEPTALRIYDLFEMKQCGFRSVVFVFADRCALSAWTGTLAQEQGRSNQRKRKSASRDEPMVYWFQAPTNA
jgi:hypothetical protein